MSVTREELLDKLKNQLDNNYTTYELVELYNANRLPFEKELETTFSDEPTIREKE